MWSIIAALHRDEIGVHPERISNLRKYADNYDWSGITFPVHPRDIKVWEEKNTIWVNVLGHSDSVIYIVKTDRDSYDTTVNLFLLETTPIKLLLLTLRGFFPLIPIRMAIANIIAPIVLYILLRRIER